MWEWCCRWELWQQVALFFFPPVLLQIVPFVQCYGTAGCCVQWSWPHVWTPHVLLGKTNTSQMSHGRTPAFLCTSPFQCFPDRGALQLFAHVFLSHLFPCFDQLASPHPAELTPWSNHTLLAAHLCLPRLWVWCCLAQLLGYPLLFLSIYSLWALPPGSLDVDVLLLTKKKREKESNMHSFHKGKYIPSIFWLYWSGSWMWRPVLSAHCVRWNWNCTVQHFGFSLCFAKALESAVVYRFLHKGKRL